MIILIVSLVIGIVLQIYVRFKIGEDEGATLVAAGASDLVMGCLWHEAACINMEYDRYTWIGDLSGHEMFYYFMRYGGLFLAIAGVVSVAAGFYWRISKSCEIKQEKKEVSQPTEAKFSAAPQISASPMPQGRVPAWKQVEMEKQNQNQ